MLNAEIGHYAHYVQISKCVECQSSNNYFMKVWASLFIYIFFLFLMTEYNMQYLNIKRSPKSLKNIDITHCEHDANYE